MQLNTWLRQRLRSLSLLVPLACTILSFLWIVYALERHSFAEIPGPSWCIFLGTAGGVLHCANNFVAYLPGVKAGRQGHDSGGSTRKRTLAISVSFTEKALVISVSSMIIVRLALLSFVQKNYACSYRGSEYLLPIFLCILSYIGNPKTHRVKQDCKKKDDDNNSDSMDQTMWDDIFHWFYNSFAEVIRPIAECLLCLGAFLAVRETFPSTIPCCSTARSATLIVGSQLLGHTLDACIIVALVTAAIKSPEPTARFRTLSRISLCSSAGVAFVWILGIFFSSEASLVHLTLDCLVNLCFDGVILALLLIYATFLQHTLDFMVPVILITTGLGLWVCFENMTHIGDFQAITRHSALAPYIMICVGLGAWILSGILTNDLILMAIATTLVVAALITCVEIVKHKTKDHIEYHALSLRIYNARIDHHRWALNAAISQFFWVAVNEYKERHGRDPPPKFETWYNFAKEKKSLVIDSFNQIRDDLAPFYSLSKVEIGRRLKESSALENVQTIMVRNGTVMTQSVHASVRDLEQMIALFSQHLPDMNIPVNTAEQPRILAPWYQAASWSSKVAERIKLSKRQGTKKMELRDHTGTSPFSTSTTISPTEFRRLIANTCAPHKAIHSYHYNTRDLCLSCVEWQSKAQYLRFNLRGLDLCHQPDLLLQHDFHLTSPVEKPVTRLLPLFSRTKTNAFSDIIVPLAAGTTDVSDIKPFDNKQTRLHWRGYLPDTQSSKSDIGIRSGHIERLLYLVNNATDDDGLTVSMPIYVGDDTGNLIYERFRASDANQFIKFDIRPLAAPQTKQILHRRWHEPIDLPRTDDSAPFTTTPASDPDKPSTVDPSYKPFAAGASSVTSPDIDLDSRFVLVMDTATAPPPAGQLEQSLRLATVPFVASIFREWHTERLGPWTHYIPIDLRWHGLHATLAYFTGVRGTAYLPSLARDIERNRRVEEKRKALERENKRKADAQTERHRQWAEKQKGKEAANGELTHPGGGEATSKTKREESEWQTGGEGSGAVRAREDAKSTNDGYVDLSWDGAWLDAHWVATQGQKWAAKALRDEDRQIYTFRLLLEWGRILEGVTL